MTPQSVRSYVFATEFLVPRPESVWLVLDKHKESLVDLGAHYVFAYEATTDPGRVMVIIGVRTEQPLHNLLRSGYLLSWFDALGIDDIPAVFAGETVERIEVSPDPSTMPTDIVVAAVTPVDDVEGFIGHVRDSVDGFALAGIRRTLVYRAFGNADEVMFLQQLASEESALKWARRSDVAAEWLAAAGVGAYPPVFVGKFAYSQRFEGPAGRSLR